MLSISTHSTILQTTNLSLFRLMLFYECQKAFSQGHKAWKLNTINHIDNSYTNYKISKMNIHNIFV
jgi:hypothetical protein